MSSPFTVIKGGKKAPLSDNKHRYVSGWITNTRLMGAEGVCLTWSVTDRGEQGILYQIFYLDSETRAIDTYYECVNEKTESFRAEEQRLCATLGGSPEPITEREARFLLQAHVRSRRHPADVREPERAGYRFLLTPSVILTGQEYASLMARICGELPTPRFIINYYLMRAAALDTAGMAFLSADGGFRDPERIYPGQPPDRFTAGPFSISAPVTLCQNRIDPSPDGSSFYCHSLTERSDAYYITSSELVLTPDRTRVLRAERTSEFRITDVEAAMMLRSTELITVFTFPEDSDELRAAFREFTIMCTDNSYRNGHLYVQFHADNSHVGRALYRLNDDMRCVFYFSNQGQLLLMCSDPLIAFTEENLLLKALQPFRIVVGTRFEFPDPVLYEFINSDFDDFMDFLDYFCEYDD